MTPQDVLDRLATLGDPAVKARAIRNGAGDAQFGVKLGDLRKLAKSLGRDQALARALWDTGHMEARLVAILMFRPADLSAAELDAMVRANRVMQVSDWLNSYVVKAHPDKEALRQAWMQDDDPVALRAGWSLTAERVETAPEGLDLDALLDRIEADLATADPIPQWTMNNTLAAIGIHHPAHRARALDIGERLGVYRDYPTPKGCTSPFAPLWIGEMVRRQT